MEYFEGGDELTIDESGLPQKPDNVISSAPPPIEEPTTEIPLSENKEIEPETVEISKSVVNHLAPQENKYWRFSFKNKTNTDGLVKAIKAVQNDLTVDFGVPQNTPDITIKDPSDQIVGKLNLLLCDRRDANLPEKYYCKIYFYQFKNSNKYQAIKTAVVNFFEGLKGASTPSKETGGKRYKRRGTIKRRRIVNKKKSMKRR